MDVVRSSPQPGDSPTAGDVIARTLELARTRLGMDMAYLADTRGGRQHYRTVTGDGASFGARAGESVPLAGTYCELVLRGEHDGVVPDTARDPRVRDLAITAAGGIGAYVGVPMHLSDGRPFGTFCCLSHEGRPSLSDRELELVGVLAELVAAQLEREELLAAARKAELAAGQMTALMAALAARDGYTSEHSDAVVGLAVAVGHHLGLGDAALTDLRSVALLHDIGKIGIPDGILRKRGPLDAEEWTVMCEHPAIGARIVAAMPPLARLAPAIRAEHERWDGGGYPDGLAGRDIPLASRVVLACDAWHAMTSDRPYRKALARPAAVAELRRHAGVQFCPDVVDALLDVLG